MPGSRLTRDEALASSARYQTAHPGQTGVRKAYAALGDDTTLSRFVKVDDGHHKRKTRGAQLWMLNLRHEVLRLGRSIFWRNRVKAPGDATNVLVSGHSNVKIGRDVRKGALRGFWIYTLTLEERNTCPRSCNHWDDCYGNNMPYAKRIEHGPELLKAIEEAVKRLLAKRNRRGILIRLHALGDFYSVEYVRFWAGLLLDHPRLAVYGYTARRGDAIAAEIETVRVAFGPRFMMRGSDSGSATHSTVSIEREEDCPPGAIVCPEQTGKTRCCATCALCWTTDKPIAFIGH